MLKAILITYYRVTIKYIKKICKTKHKNIIKIFKTKKKYQEEYQWGSHLMLSGCPIKTDNSKLSILNIFMNINRIKIKTTIKIKTKMWTINLNLNRRITILLHLNQLHYSIKLNKLRIQPNYNYSINMACTCCKCNVNTIVNQ